MGFGKLPHQRGAGLFCPGTVSFKVSHKFFAVGRHFKPCMESLILQQGVGESKNRGVGGFFTGQNDRFFWIGDGVVDEVPFVVKINGF